MWSLAVEIQKMLFHKEMILKFNISVKRFRFPHTDPFTLEKTDYFNVTSDLFD